MSPYYSETDWVREEPHLTFHCISHDREFPADIETSRYLPKDCSAKTLQLEQTRGPSGFYTFQYQAIDDCIWQWETERGLFTRL